MSIEAESLLAATGLVAVPDRTSIAASRTVVKDLVKQLVAVLDRDDQKRLRVNNQTENYIKQLGMPPDYDRISAAIEPKFGLAIAGEYQLLHQEIRQRFLDSYPAQEVDTARGTRSQPPDPELLAQWLLEVDTIENQRIVSDLAAGAVLPETVKVFKDSFPEIYSALLGELSEAIAKRPFDWLPPVWLEMALATFTGQPQVGAPPMPAKDEAAPKGRARFDLKTMTTPAQKAQEA